MENLTPLDQFDFHATLGDTPGPAVVLFQSPGCASCRLWKRLLTEYRGRHPGVSVFAVDVQQDMALAREFEVFHLPALYLYLDGRFHCELQSEAQPGRFHRALSAALNAAPQEAP